MLTKARVTWTGKPLLVYSDRDAKEADSCLDFNCFEQ